VSRAFYVIVNLRQAAASAFNVLQETIEQREENA
jgi:hypothetical protein